MSSPFDVFRKNQRVVMAGLVLVAIASFVVAPTIQYMSQGNNLDPEAANSPLQGTLVEWRGGSINSRQYRLINYKSRSSFEVIRQLMETVQKAGGQPLIQPDLPFPSGVENIRRKMLAQKGAEMGIVIDDATIDEYLRQLVNGKVNNKQFNQFLKEQDSSTQAFSRFDLYEYLKESLVANMVKDLAMTGVASRQSALLTPSRNWQMFLRFHQRQKIEAFPVNTDDMLASVTAEPTDADLKALYDAGSNRYPNKAFPDPGFRQPYQAEVEFAAVNLESFIEAERKKLTEEEIQKTYEQRVAAGRYMVPDTTPTPPASDKEATPPAEGTQEKSTEQPDGSAGTPNAAPAGTQAPAATPALPDEGEPPAPVKDGGNADEPPKQDQASSGGLRARFVSTQDPSPTAPAPTQPPASTEAAQPPTDTKPTDAPSPPMRKQPLEEVRQELTREMVFATASAKMRDAVEKLKKALFDHSEKMQMYYQAEQMKGNKMERPTAIDLEKLCNETGLTYGRTGLFDFQSVEALEIAKSRKLMNGQVASFAEVALYGVQLYQVENTKSISAGSITDYYFWKVDERKERLPDLSEIKDQVTAAWKKIEARKLAAKRAEALVKQVEAKAENPWNGVLSETERALVIAPATFTWMQSAMPPSYRPEISFVDNLDLPGFEFMKQVCNAPVGEFVVAPNQSLSVYYVVRVVDKLPSDADLKAQFANSKMDMNSMFIAFNEANTFQTEWIRELDREMQVNWIVSPDTLQQLN